MIALKRLLLLAATMPAVSAVPGGIEPSLGQDKKQERKLQRISVMTRDLWWLDCFPDGSGHVGWAASPNGLHSTSFKAGTLDFRAMEDRIKELSDKEAVGIVMDGKVITSTLSKAGALEFKAKLEPVKELSGEDAMVFVRDGKAIRFRANVECYSIRFTYGGNQDDDEGGEFPHDAKGTNEFLSKVFRATVSEKVTKLKGKEFDRVWSEKPPPFMPR